jgi:hypothetical protein
MKSLGGGAQRATSDSTDRSGARDKAKATAATISNTPMTRPIQSLMASLPVSRYAQAVAARVVGRRDAAGRPGSIQAAPRARRTGQF